MSGGGDRIKVGNLTGNTGVAIGRGAQASVSHTSGVSGDEQTKLFATVYGQIEQRPDDTTVEKAEITETVQKIEAEAK